VRNALQVDRPSAARYPIRMRPPFEEIVAATGGTTVPADILRGLVTVVQQTWNADQVMLSNGGASPLYAHPENARVTVDLHAFSEAPAVMSEGNQTFLGVALRPFARSDWHLVLARAGGKQWTADERDLLARSTPHLALAIAHALLHGQVAESIEQEAEAIKGNERFLNVLSHELRNPLAPILMWTSTLRRLRRNDPEVQRATEAIAQAVSMERRLIEELLDVSRLQRGGVELSRRPLDLRDLVRGAIDGSELERAGLSLVQELPDEPVQINADADRLRQAVANLVANAVRYTPKGGTVAVTVERRGERAYVRVSDTGPGLPPEILPTLFRPFVQGPNAHGGLGVGLAVTHGLVALHQGTLEALERGELGGATLVVTLPAGTATSGA
jgi:signal transduction histidine kinase